MPEVDNACDRAEKCVGDPDCPLYLKNEVHQQEGERQAALAAAHADGVAEGLRQATESWEREWAVALGLPGVWPLHPCDDEADARSCAASRAGRFVVSRLVGPWGPVEPDPHA